MKYTSLARVPKVFHGVTFLPGETKEVSGYINDPEFIVSRLCEPPDISQKVPSSKTAVKKKLDITSTESAVKIDKEGEE